MNPRKERKKEVQQVMMDILAKAPTRVGYTVQELSAKIDMPEPTARVHLELLEESNRIESYYIGKSRIYKPKKE